MADIDAAVAELVDVIRTNIPEIRFTPDDPVETNERWPLCLVFGQSGSYNNGPPDIMRGLHAVTIMLFVKRAYKTGLADAHALLTSIQDKIPNALLQAVTDGVISETATSSVISTFGSIDYTKQLSIDYNGIDCIALVYTINDLKIMETLS